MVTIRDRSKYVSRDGKFKNPYRNQDVTFHYNKDGYPCCGGGIPAHLYVAHGWIDGYFEGAEVNHKDFDRNNYSADNLEWLSHSDNIQYSVDNNYDRIRKSKTGVNNGRATFTEEDIKTIRNYYDSGMSIASIVKLDYPDLIHASQYKNIHSKYSKICKRETWKNVV